MNVSPINKAVYFDFEKTRLQSEEWECAMLVLDGLGIPRIDDGQTLSIVGRIKLISSHEPMR
jgi:hypothetical protein